MYDLLVDEMRDHLHRSLAKELVLTTVGFDELAGDAMNDETDDVWEFSVDGS